MLMKHMRSWIQMYQLQGIMSLLLLLLAASCSDSEKELEEPFHPFYSHCGMDRFCRQFTCGQLDRCFSPIR